MSKKDSKEATQSEKKKSKKMKNEEPEEMAIDLEDMVWNEKLQGKSIAFNYLYSRI